MEVIFGADEVTLVYRPGLMLIGCRAGGPGSRLREATAATIDLEEHAKKTMKFRRARVATHGRSHVDARAEAPPFTPDLANHRHVARRAWNALPTMS